ncbi:MAG: hypothetical protein U0228_22675 [Myxococcaceae bacterium]
MPFHRRGALLLCSLVLAACPGGDEPPDAGFDAGPPPKPAKPTVAQLGALKGDVKLKRDGATAAAVAGALFEGDVVTTGADGHAVLKAGSREVELLEQSSFTVGKSLSELTASSGELFFEEADGGEFSTTGGSARAGAGSRVKLDSRDGGTTFIVTSGSLEFTDPEDGGVSSAKVGQRLVVGRGVVEFEDAPAPAAKPVVKLSPRGSVMLKSKSGANARIPNQGKDLAELGTVSVDKFGGLRAQLGGAVLQFEGGAKGTVEPAESDPKLRATLQAGAMRVFLEQGESVLLDGKKPIKLTAKLAMTALVTPTKNGPRVELLAGDGEAALGDALPRNVSGGEVLAIKGKTLESSRRAAPLLQLPAGRNVRVFWGRPGDVELSFAEGDGVMEVASDGTFGSLVASGAGKSLVVPGPLKGALFWRRRGDTEASSARFERDELAGAVAAKSDTVSETGLKATVYFQSAVPTLTFNFLPREGIKSWVFRVYADGKEKAVLERKVTEGHAVVESGVLGEGNYNWTAAPIDASGQEVGVRANKMEIVFDNSVTRLVLSSPRDGERASQAVGVAPLGGKLTLNGKPVQVDDSGRFTVSTGGASVLVFRLNTKDGGEAFWVRRVSR